MDAEFAVVGNAGHELHMRGVSVNLVRGNGNALADGDDGGSVRSVTPQLDATRSRTALACQMADRGSVAHPTETVVIESAVSDEVSFHGTIPRNRCRGLEHLATSTETGHQQ